jgi:hypothetical protein
MPGAVNGAVTVDLCPFEPGSHSSGRVMIDKFAAILDHRVQLLTTSERGIGKRTLVGMVREGLRGAVRHAAGWSDSHLNWIGCFVHSRKGPPGALR